LTITSLVCIGVAVSLTPATGANAQGQCTATLSFDTFEVITDTDVNPPYTHPDQWTVHIYAYVNRVQGTANERKNGVFQGDSGTVVTVPNGTMLDHAVVGAEGGPVVLDIRAGPKASRVKEGDSAKGTRGVSPADRNPFGLRDMIAACDPGTRTYTVDVSIPASPGGTTGEHDGFVRLTFTLTLS
jgi:hypothetical protein